MIDRVPPAVRGLSTDLLSLLLRETVLPISVTAILLHAVEIPIREAAPLPQEAAQAMKGARLPAGVATLTPHHQEAPVQTEAPHTLLPAGVLHPAAPLAVVAVAAEAQVLVQAAADVQAEAVDKII